MKRSPKDNIRLTTSAKRSTTKKKKLDNLISKLNKAAEENKDQSAEILSLKNHIKDLTHLE